MPDQREPRPRSNQDARSPHDEDAAVSHERDPEGGSEDRDQRDRYGAGGRSGYEARDREERQSGFGGYGSSDQRNDTSSQGRGPEEDRSRPGYDPYDRSSRGGDPASSRDRSEDW